MLSMGHLARDIAEQLHHSAAYFSEEHADRLVADIREIANVDWQRSKDLFTQRKADLLLSYGYDGTDPDRKPFAFAAGAAIIPVHGILVNRFSGSYSFATGYNFIRSQRIAALADPDVEIIVYDYNTYGGHAAGCGELSKEMFETRGMKPSLAIIDANCYSAGYFLASAQDRIAISPSGGCGSIGCVAMHVDFSEALKNEGIKITFIKSADPKTDGNPYEPLSARAKRNIQRSVDYHAKLFIDAVARNRDADEDEIRGTEALCYDPPEALENGLVDEVLSPSEAINSFLESLDGGSSMAKETTEATTPVSAPAMTAEQLAAAIASGIASALPTALAAHDKTKTERRAAILGCDEAKTRQKFAAHLADNTSYSVDDAKGLLAMAAEEKPEQPEKKGKGESPFAKAMDETRNPQVGADSEDETAAGEKSDIDLAAGILGSYSAMTGNKVIPIKKAG